MKETEAEHQELDGVGTSQIIRCYAATDMLGGIFTKPLQGALFRNFRAEIMDTRNDINMENIGMNRTGKKRELCGSYITILTLNAHRSVLGIVRI